MNLGYRLHNMPALLALNDKQSGQAVMKNSSGTPAAYARGNKPVFFGAPGNADSAAPFELPKHGDFNGNIVELRAPWSKPVLTVTFEDPKDLKGIVYWDSDKMKTCTFEAIYNPKELAPGTIKTYTSLWTITK